MIDLKNKNVRISITAITTALYVVLGLVFQPISYLGLQFRIAELMVGMVLIFPVAGLLGNCLGVFVVNLFSPLGILDCIISPFVNIPALMCIAILRNKGKFGKYLGGLLYALIISLYVAWLLWFVLSLPYWLMFIQVMISETILSTLGILLFSKIQKRLDLEDSREET